MTHERAKELHACARREHAMRENCYPGWVERGRMTAKKAAQELADMADICAVLKELVEKLDPQEELF